MMTSKDGCKSKICPVSLGIAIGVAKAICVMLFVWSSMHWGVGASMMDMMVSIYPGVSATVGGSFIAGLWGLLDGLVFGIIVGLVYNCCMSRCCTRCCAGSCESKKDTLS